MTFAPVVLFVYERPEHTRQTLDALQRNPEARSSDLIVFADAPANDASVAGVTATRQIVESITGFRSVTVNQQGENRGLAGSIIAGVTQVLRNHEKVIVVEDDLVTSPCFLRFMNDALDRYAVVDRVATVHGYKYPSGKTPDGNFLLKYVDSWGWGTWRDRWQLFQPDGLFLLEQIRSHAESRIFDFNGTFPFTRMLADQVQGKNDSWAIRWYASLFLANKLSLYPRYSLVNTIGLDASGVHCSEEDRFFSTEIYQGMIPVDMIPIEESREMRDETAAYFKRVIPTRFERIVKRLKRTLSLFG